MRASLIAAGSLSAWSLACDATAVESFAAADCPSLAGAAADMGGGARPPAALADTGLYCDAAAFATAPGVEAFRPAYEGWSDGADKTRWIYLPECDGVIDNTDEDHWSFPGLEVSVTTDARLLDPATRAYAPSRRVRLTLT